MNQQVTPLYDALKRYIARKIVPFHVPAHKQNRVLGELGEAIGGKALAMDLTCLPDLDNICSPVGPIRDAEQLAASAYGADQAFFIVNGTTSAIQTMIATVCGPGEKLILPRNVHKSATGGLILSGVMPIYVNPEIDTNFGISTGVTLPRIMEALQLHSDARAVFLINPNYYGTTSELVEIIAACHARGVPVIVDEAHGAHFSFHPDLPPSAIEAGADLIASSTHKLVGSMTQSSMLFVNEGLVDSRRVKTVLNLSQTTSPSYLLLASLDIARKMMATQGRELLDQALILAQRIRNHLSREKWVKLLQDPETIPGCTDLDPLKIVMNVKGWGFSGFEVDRILREEYNLQVELSDLYNVIILITIADDSESVDYLLRALKDIPQKYPFKNVLKYCPPPPPLPEVCLSPREAFYADIKVIPLQEAEGEVSAETITAYPPGIPLICAGERITREIIDYINILKHEHAELQGAEDLQLSRIKIVKHLGGAERKIEEGLSL